MGDPLGILHHPAGLPLADSNRQRSVKKIVPHRIRHTTHVQPGSSGAPCFDVTWRWVAVHQKGFDKLHKLKGYTWNSAIPADLIRDHIHATSEVRLHPFTAPAFRIDFDKPRFVDFRPTSFPMEKPAPDPGWMDNDLLITVPINLNMKQGVQPVQLTSISANLSVFSSASTYRWKWKAEVAKYGKGTTGQYASARTEHIAPGGPLAFGAQFASTLGTQRPTWRQFHDLIIATEAGKIILTLTFLIEGYSYDMPIELSTLHLRELFAEGDKNGYGMTRYMQPRTL